MGVQLELGGLGAHLSVAQCQLERANAMLDSDPTFLFFGDRSEIDDGFGIELGVGRGGARRVQRFGCVQCFGRVYCFGCVQCFGSVHCFGRMQRFGRIARFVRFLRGLQLAL